MSAYGRLLRTPGAGRLAAGALTSFVATTMSPVAFVLFAREATGSYARAGLVVAGLTAGTVATQPLRGRLVDRRGPGAAALVLAVPSAATDAILILAGHGGAAAGILVLLALASGSTTPPVGTALRAVWAATLHEDDRQAGFALLSALGEVSYFVGPLVAGVLAAAASPTFAVAATAALVFAGALAFASAAPRRSAPAEPGDRRPLAHGPLRVIVATGALFGLTFGALDVALPASAQARGSTVGAGVLLSAIAVGVGTTSLVYGARAAGGSVLGRYPALTLLAAAGLTPMLIAPGSLVVFALLAVLAGAAFAPISVTQNAAVGETAPAGTAGEAFAWLSTAYGAGSAAGAAVAGTLVSGPGARAAIALACAATFAAAAVSLRAARAGAAAPRRSPPR